MTIENPTESFKSLVEVDAAQLPEPVFVEHILPILTNRSGNQNFIKWQLIAGHVMRPIDVFDPATGQVLFRVPPILRTVSDAITKKGIRMSIPEIVSIAEKKSAIIPALGDKYIQTHLTNRIEKVPVYVDDVIAWNAILLRYNKEPILKTEITVNDENKPIETIHYEGFDDL